MVGIKISRETFQKKEGARHEGISFGAESRLLEESAYSEHNVISDSLVTSAQLQGSVLGPRVGGNVDKEMGKFNKYHLVSLHKFL